MANSLIQNMRSIVRDKNRTSREVQYDEIRVWFSPSISFIVLTYVPIASSDESWEEEDPTIVAPSY